MMDTTEAVQRIKQTHGFLGIAMRLDDNKSISSLAKLAIMYQTEYIILLQMGCIIGARTKKSPEMRCSPHGESEHFAE